MIIMIINKYERRINQMANTELKTELIQIRATKTLRKMLIELTKSNLRTISGQMEYMIKKEYEEMKKNGGK